MAYKAVIFDLDGTLLDTAGDLTDAVNFALSQEGLPCHTQAEITAFLGNGIRRLVELSVPEDTPLAQVDRVFDAFRAYYGTHYLVKTAPYPGMHALAKALKDRGVRTALVTNKADAVAQDIYNATFRDVIPVAIGEQPRYRKKPAPDMVEAALSKLDCKKQDAVYVGDSEVDLATAKNSGLPCILVDWGFRSREFLASLGNDVIVSTPEALLEAI